METEEKIQKLRSILAGYGKAAVAYSGGVDSTLLCRLAFDALGDKAMAVTLASPMVPASEVEQAETLAAQIGISHFILQDPVIDETVARNPADRCYHCKKLEFGFILDFIRPRGTSILMEGSNADDLNDYRPGLAAVRELDVKSPLREAGLTKSEIRELSRGLGLPTWNKPSMACLASRIPYGETITIARLHRVEEAENWLRNKGFIQYRVRSHGDLARIEVAPEDRSRFADPAFMDETAAVFRGFGFHYVTLDLQGYSTGSLNRSLNQRQALS